MAKVPPQHTADPQAVPSPEKVGNLRGTNAVANNSGTEVAATTAKSTYVVAGIADPPVATSGATPPTNATLRVPRHQAAVQAVNATGGGSTNKSNASGAAVAGLALAPNARLARTAEPTAAASLGSSAQAVNATGGGSANKSSVSGPAVAVPALAPNAKSAIAAEPTAAAVLRSTAQA